MIKTITVLKRNLDFVLNEKITEISASDCKCGSCSPVPAHTTIQKEWTWRMKQYNEDHSMIDPEFQFALEDIFSFDVKQEEKKETKDILDLFAEKDSISYLSYETDYDTDEVIFKVFLQRYIWS